MGLEEVRKEVLRKATAEATKIKAVAEKEGSKILQQAEQRVAGYKKKTGEEIQRSTELLKRREITQATLDVRNDMLKAKKAAIDMAFEKALQKLVKAQASKKAAMLKKLLAKAESEIDVATVYCNKADMGLLKHKELSPIDRHGIIAENKDKSIRVDYCFDTLLQQIKEAHVAEVARKLFD